MFFSSLAGFVPSKKRGQQIPGKSRISAHQRRASSYGQPLCFTAVLLVMLSGSVQAEVEPAPAAAVLQTPFYFERNDGQTDPAVDFVSRGPGYTIFLSGDEAVLSLRLKPTQPSQSKPAKSIAAERKPLE